MANIRGRQAARFLIAAAIIGSLVGSAEARTLRQYKQRVMASSVSTAGLAAPLQSLISELRSRHGAGSVRVISGRAHRYVRPGLLSCHASGQAFDANMSAAALADVRGRRQFGLIFYSGSMNHVHVASCSREAGIRVNRATGSSRVATRRGTRKSSRSVVAAPQERDHQWGW